MTTPTEKPKSDRIEDYKFFYTEHTRFDDLDPLGHINNIAFAVYAEGSRIDWERRYLKSYRAPGEGFVIVRIEIDFMHEMHYPGTIEIGIRPVRVGRSSLSFRQALFQNGTCCAIIHAVIVHFDLAARVAKPFSPTMLQRIHELIAEAAVS
jgi:acyl-CoA thioester hydrolase